MSAAPGVPAATAAAGPSADQIARLTKTAKQLEGVFVNQLFKAMRDTVPQEGGIDSGAGEQMFTSMFDEQLSDRVPQQWKHSLADAMVSRLKDRMTAQSNTAAAQASSTPANAPEQQ